MVLRKSCIELLGCILKDRMLLSWLWLFLVIMVWFRCGMMVLLICVMDRLGFLVSRKVLLMVVLGVKLLFVLDGIVVGMV